MDVQEELQKLKRENHNLKEQLENFIPRRRVRRVYKMLGKILKQDGIVDDLESELLFKEKIREKIDSLELQCKLCNVRNLIECDTQCTIGCTKHYLKELLESEVK